MKPELLISILALIVSFFSLLRGWWDSYKKRCNSALILNAQCLEYLNAHLDSISRLKSRTKHLENRIHKICGDCEDEDAVGARITIREIILMAEEYEKKTCEAISVCYEIMDKFEPSLKGQLCLLKGINMIEFSFQKILSNSRVMINRTDVAHKMIDSLEVRLGSF